MVLLKKTQSPIFFQLTLIFTIIKCDWKSLEDLLYCCKHVEENEYCVFSRLASIVIILLASISSKKRNNSVVPIFGFTKHDTATSICFNIMDAKEQYHSFCLGKVSFDNLPQISPYLHYPWEIFKTLTFRI